MDVRLYRARLLLTDAEARALHGILSPDERERAAAFAFPHLRRRYIAGRAFLRGVLGQATGRPPWSLRFGYGEHGKPFLLGEGAPRFNLSHSEDAALLALAQGPELGVDLERLRPLPDALGIARSCFCPSEQRALAAAPAAERQALFFRLWTRKEAVLKALGTGLSLPPDAVEVTAGGEPRLLRLRGQRSAASGYLLQDLDGGAGFAAALCVAGSVPGPPQPAREWDLAAMAESQAAAPASTVSRS